MIFFQNYSLGIYSLKTNKQKPHKKIKKKKKKNLKKQPCQMETLRNTFLA